MTTWLMDTKTVFNLSRTPHRTAGSAALRSEQNDRHHPWPVPQRVRSHQPRGHRKWRYCLPRSRSHSRASPSRSAASIRLRVSMYSFSSSILAASRPAFLPPNHTDSSAMATAPIPASHILILPITAAPLPDTLPANPQQAQSRDSSRPKYDVLRRRIKATDCRCNASCARCGRACRCL